MGDLLPNKLEIANLQATYYENKIIRVKNLLPRVNYDPLQSLKRAHDRWIPIGGRPRFELKTVTVSQVSEMIRKLKPSHAYGNDQIDGYTIRLIGPTIAPVITHISSISPWGLHSIQQDGNLPA